MMRIGYGYDLHKLVENRDLIIGGIKIPYPKGEEAHSDGDVLIHALIDALLGAMADGDIGTHYPPSDPKWKNISSMTLLKQTMERVDQKGYTLINIDCTVILEAPKLGPYKAKIAKELSAVLNLDLDAISIKAKTKEKQDSVGQGLAIESHVALLLERKK